MTAPLLLLDLDETILHSSTIPPTGGSDFNHGAYYTRLRPHLKSFLQAVLPLWQVGVFTAAGHYYARGMIDGIHRTTGINLLTSNLLLDARHCTPSGSLMRKNLEQVENRGFNLARTVIIDDKPRGVLPHDFNTLPAPAWHGNPGDTFLKSIIPLLEQMAAAPDVRLHLAATLQEPA